MENASSYKKSSFGPAFFFLSPAQREALADYYEFCRLVDDIADEPTQDPHGQLDFWTEEIHHIYHHQAQTDLGKRLQDAVEKYQLRPEWFLLLIQGMRDDLDGKVYHTAEELAHYIHCVAVVVGQTTLAMLGLRGEKADELAWALGSAVQLTNIVRDTAEDAQRGRVYLPIDVSPAALLCRPLPDEIKTYLQQLAAKAREEYQTAFSLMKNFSRRQMLPCRIMGYVYLKNLAKIEREGFVSIYPIKLTKGEKIRAVFYALFKTFF